MCENEEEKFEERLPRVKKAIRDLKCKKKIQLCNSWVARLQHSDPDEYELRNQYLYLLWKQLVDRHLDAPFLACPPGYGKLPPLEKQGNKCCGSARSSSLKGSCCNNKCQRNGCTRESCCAKTRPVPDIPQNLDIPEIRKEVIISDGASNTPSATETQAPSSRETSVVMSLQIPHSNESPKSQGTRIYQETPNSQETGMCNQLYEVSPDEMSQRTPSELVAESPDMSCGGMHLEVPGQLADYATPAGYEGSTMRAQTECRSAPPQLGCQFRDCQTDMRHFYDLMGGSRVRNVPPGPATCSASTPDPMPEARRRLDMSHDKYDSQHNSEYLLISEETPRSLTPQESARISQNRNSPVNRRCLQPKLLDNAFKRRLAEMNYIYNLRMKTLDERVNTVDRMNSALRSQLGQLGRVEGQLTTQNRADEQMIRCLRDENRTLKLKIQKSYGNGAGIRHVGPSIEQLECCLNESINFNNALQKSLEDLDEKIKLMQRTKAQEVCELQTRQAKNIQSIKTMNNVKIMSLSKDYQRKLQSMEESYKEQLRSYEAEHGCNIQRLISENEATFQEFKDSTNQLIIEKEVEIERLQTSMEEQCSKLQADVQGMQSRAGDECNNAECVACREKVCIMKERLRRADNIKKKCLRYFQSKLFEMLKEKHKHENTVKMLLMKQRAEITLQVFNECQIEMKDAVSHLQERYKRIISSMQEQISSNKVEVADIMGIQAGSARKRCFRSPNPECEDKTDQT